MSDSSQTSDLLQVDSAALLRRCVQCGLCLPHCATWAATGNEVHSPRGRLVLLADLLVAPADERNSRAAAYRDAFDHCIGCRACEAVCPSGVPYSLLSMGQALTGYRESRDGDSGRQTNASRERPLISDRLLASLDSRAWLRVIARTAGLARGALALLLGAGWRRRLAGHRWSGGLGRRLGSLPVGPGPDRALLERLDRLCGHEATALVPAKRRATPPETPVLFFGGCANEGLLPDTSRRLRELLRAAGCAVETPSGQGCCGALAAHTGRPGRAARLARSNRQAFAPQGGEAAPVIVEAAGCGLALKEYEPGLGRPVFDAVVWLAGRPLPPLGPVPLRVAVHDPCHARHGQGIVAEPRRLLAAIPDLVIVEPAEAEVCCGSGGAWGLRHPDLASDLGRRKAGFLTAAGADLVVTSNPGCLGQIADALAATAAPGRPPVPIIPLTDLIWYAMRRARP